MRVICIVCGTRGRINKTNWLSENVADLYCQCTDAACGHRWVSTLAYSRTLIPSRRRAGDVLTTLMSLPREQRAALASAINQQLVAEQAELNKR